MHNDSGDDRMALFQDAGLCLDELESEYLSVGIEHCRGLEDQSHVSAFLILGIRSICLLRGMLRLADPQFLDAYDTVRRSFIESWQLQFEFKIRGSGNKVQKWLVGLPDTWNADRTRLERLVEKLQGGRAGFGREWGELSEMAHPTIQAAVNSVSIASTIAGVNPRPQKLDEAFRKLTKDYIGLLNREIWLTLQVCADFIETPLKEDRFPKCLELHSRFLKAEADSGKA